jgi:hypothetical protein
MFEGGGRQVGSTIGDVAEVATWALASSRDVIARSDKMKAVSNAPIKRWRLRIARFETPALFIWAKFGPFIIFSTSYGFMTLLLMASTGTAFDSFCVGNYFN